MLHILFQVSAHKFCEGDIIFSNSASGYIMYLIYHMTSQVHLIKGPCKLMVENSSRYFTTITISVTIGIFIVKICFKFVTWPHVTTCSKVMWIYGWKPLTVSHQLVMFGDHWSGATGDRKYLICHVNSQNKVIEGSCNIMSGSSL